MARAAFGALLALVLAVRLLAPAGFMPSFEHGVVAIVACPETTGVEPMAAHHDGHGKIVHQPCPFAAASGKDSLAASALAAALFVATPAGLLQSPVTISAACEHRCGRPPSTGPPNPA